MLQIHQAIQIYILLYKSTAEGTIREIIGPIKYHLGDDSVEAVTSSLNKKKRKMSSQPLLKAVKWWKAIVEKIGEV